MYTNCPVSPFAQIWMQHNRKSMIGSPYFHGLCVCKKMCS